MLGDGSAGVLLGSAGVVLGSAGVVLGVGSTGVVLGDGSTGVVLGDGDGALGSVGVGLWLWLGEGAGLDGADEVGGLDEGCAEEVGPGEVCDGDAGGDQGGFGAAGVDDGCAEGNQLVVGLDVPGFSRVGRFVGPCVGDSVTVSGEAPSGRPTGGLVVVLPSEPSEVVLSGAVGRGGRVVAESCPPNGTKRSRPTRDSAAAARAPSFRTGGPP
ncbi:hypothetical protein ACGFIF_39565 [Kribbella sp. NPDC049174]|uniref:hypothetical protein n=1 Tax=Kribbella sp. NPDC049174 TaxID=3364112 RepID=UPI00371D8692